MRLAWLTDVHLNFLSEEEVIAFLDRIQPQADAFLITGDIGESPSLVALLRQFEERLRRPVCFVLGNHDFYHGSIHQTRAETVRASAASDHLHYLTDEQPVELSATACVVGHDGWGDARLGNCEGTPIRLNDFRLIAELAGEMQDAGEGRRALHRKLRTLGDEAARRLERVIGNAAERFSQIVVATHVPPFREAVWHEAQASSNADWLPYFACKAVGDVLLRSAATFPRCEFLVLCGHTHSWGAVRLSDNLGVLTGQAEYGQPTIQRVFDLTAQGELLHPLFGGL